MTALFATPKVPKFPKLEVAQPNAASQAELERIVPKPETGAAGSVTPTPLTPEEEAAKTLKPRRRLVGVA